MAGSSLRSSSTSILASLHEESVVHPRPHSPQQMDSGNIAGVASSQTDLAAQLPVSPHEDPDLVGEAAAAMFRSQRLYITYQQQENYSVGAQNVSLATGRPHQPASAGRAMHQYSSLITAAESATPTSTPPQEENPRPSTAPNASTTPTTESELDRRAPQQPQPQAQQQEQEQQEEQEQPPPPPPPPPSERQATTGNRTTPPTTSSTITTTTRPTRQYIDDDALCAQESKTWDFMLAQMADWEERERSWKKFKDGMDKKLNSGKLGMGIGFGIGLGLGRGRGSWSNSGSSSGGNGGGGKGKLKKASSSHQFGHEKKWKRRVGLAS
ncbi:hypothetical protein BDDG_08970 [Blastomyces dermatitidis ATCC 18188]|uniref:Uncharacterized protein n=1 Tax=Ajellomyces dermatitidis (strain ATCC 18188 / CBS 674.68) TaxID=653446 RepID=F2TS12_AJEDA|nr:hypothetical protein BDDG_08970 [Blastomyces dermatitidis ATCC 18188]